MADARTLTDRDRLDIMDVLARYAQCLDQGDLDGYVANFAPDGVLFEQYHGRDQIREYVGGLMERWKTAPSVRLHFIGYPLVAGDGEQATAQTYLAWITTGDSASPVVGAARLFDTLVKLDGRWFLKSRVQARLANYVPAAATPV
jgi:ketosteroid isomerase-like protein